MSKKFQLENALFYYNLKIKKERKCTFYIRNSLTLVHCYHTSSEKHLPVPSSVHYNGATSQGSDTNMKIRFGILLSSRRASDIFDTAIVVELKPETINCSISQLGHDKCVINNKTSGLKLFF